MSIFLEKQHSIYNPRLGLLVGLSAGLSVESLLGACIVSDRGFLAAEPLVASVMGAHIVSDKGFSVVEPPVVPPVSSPVALGFRSAKWEKISHYLVFDSIHNNILYTKNIYHYKTLCLGLTLWIYEIGI